VIGYLEENVPLSRRQQIALTGLTFAVTVLFWPTTAESPVVAATPDAPRDVTVEHELIHASIVVATATPRPRLRPLRPLRTAALPPKAADSRKTPGLATRAAQAFLGDGRYRPEPFPRPGQ
jgi:hypothetical protein